MSNGHRASIAGGGGAALVVIGRDARPSGEIIAKMVASTLQSLGINVVDLGLSTTPTVEIAVTMEKAAGGIIISASHNPVQWNALKFFNDKGELISADEGENIFKHAENSTFHFAEAGNLGSYRQDNSYIQKHIDKILALPLVDVEAIKAKKFRIVTDCVNSTGGLAIPKLLNALGVSEVVELNCTPNGLFPHNPEPLPENLTTLANEVKLQRAHLGIAVDPDVDRLALICEDGEMFGEEYSLVAVADYILKNNRGNTVSNLSSTRALKDITEKANCRYFASAVGEVNVVKAMKEHDAVIGGEGNGGIIYPELHYGRDALVGIALFLTHLAKFGKSISLLRSTYPNYYISKNKIDLEEIDTKHIFEEIKKRYNKQPINTIDGVKIEFDQQWVHLRNSNTEPIIRIYAEAETAATADSLANKIMGDIKEIITEEKELPE
ncbi:MAG: phosphoglucosamine mutase [Cytophagales bacterium]|nr:phosphoglucosamine mutase [Cytophagales bacterium]